MRLKDSFWAMFGRSRSDAPMQVTEQIRVAMLKALDIHCAKLHGRLDRAIQQAESVAELWYIRPDLMHAISSCHGESMARKVVGEITEMFRGHFGVASATPSRFSTF